MKFDFEIFYYISGTLIFVLFLENVLEILEISCLLIIVASSTVTDWSSPFRRADQKQTEVDKSRMSHHKKK